MFLPSSKHPQHTPPHLPLPSSLLHTSLNPIQPTHTPSYPSTHSSHTPHPSPTHPHAPCHPYKPIHPPTPPCYPVNSYLLPCRISHFICLHLPSTYPTFLCYLFILAYLCAPPTHNAVTWGRGRVKEGGGMPSLPYSTYPSLPFPFPPQLWLVFREQTDNSWTFTRWLMV